MEHSAGLWLHKIKNLAVLTTSGIVVIVGRHVATASASDDQERLLIWMSISALKIFFTWRRGKR